MAHMKAAVSNQEAHCTLLLSIGDAEKVSSNELKEALQGSDVRAKAQAMKQLIRLHVNGEPQNDFIMTVIKHVVPEDDHLIKRLVLYYLEIIDKTDGEGRLLGFMLLICSYLLNDLRHPNEYVRGLTLRFLCKLKERDLLEPLIPAMLDNLKDSVLYVRRNAFLAMHAVYAQFPELLPDAMELVEGLIQHEGDVSARRNAFELLAAFAPERAARFLCEFRNSNELSEAGGCFLMAVVEFCRQMIKQNPYDRARYVPILFAVLESKSPAVRYQCATTLLSLSSSPTAIRQAKLTFIDLLKAHSDNTVRLIVVEQLDRMRGCFLTALQDSLVDILSVVQNASLAVCKRVMALAVELVSDKNVHNFLSLMKKELVRVQSDSDEVATPAGREYRLLVIKAIHTALLRCPQSAGNIMPVLLDHVCDGSSTASDEVVCLLKEVLHAHVVMRAPTLQKLAKAFPLLTSPTVVRDVLWLFGSYAQSADEALAMLRLLKENMAPLPLVPPLGSTPVATGQESGAPSGSAAAATLQVMTTVREDGTYATTYAPAPANQRQDDASGLRTFIVRGDYFLASALASTLARLVVQLYSSSTEAVAAHEEARSDAIALLVEMLRYGVEAPAAYAIDDDCQGHLRLCLALLSRPRAAFLQDMLQRSREAVGEVVVAGDVAPQEKRMAGEPLAPALCAVDAPLLFTQVMANGGGKDAMYEMEATDDGAALGFESPLGVAATGPPSTPGGGACLTTADFLRRIENTVALSGFCDPIYCEARVEVRQFDVLVDWLLINCSGAQLESVSIELASVGGMKLLERPQSYTLPAHGTLQVRTALKISATESGVICGNVFFEGPQQERGFVVLDNIHVDIMNYIRPAPCHLSDFRAKWCAFDWENKITVTTAKRELRDYVALIARELNMQLLEPYPALDAAELEAIPALEGGEDHEYISGHLYARTAFGEDALVNVSVERDSAGTITGIVRIRSNAQTLAYGIGERLGALQKSGKF